MSSRDIVATYAHAVGIWDLSAAPQVLADDMVEDYPQSGERVEGLANWLSLMEHWPAPENGSQSASRGLVGPRWTFTRIFGSGEHFWLSGRVIYPGGAVWHLVQLLQLREGKIARMTTYFAEPFAAAEWRKPWVASIPDEER